MHTKSYAPINMGGGDKIFFWKLYIELYIKHVCWPAQGVLDTTYIMYMYK